MILSEMTNENRQNSEFKSVFLRLVGADGGRDLASLVAYGLYKQAKSDWFNDFCQAKGRRPSPDEIEEYSRTWTDRKLEAQMVLARQRLFQFASDVVDRQPQQMREDAVSAKVGALGGRIAHLETVIIQRSTFLKERIILWGLIGSLLSGFVLIMLALSVSFFFGDGLQPVIDFPGRARDMVPKG